MENVVLDLAGLGLGGAIAIIMFFVYRREKTATESRLTELLRMDIESREKHTRVLSKLNTMVKRLNGKMR